MTKGELWGGYYDGMPVPAGHQVIRMPHVAEQTVADFNSSPKPVDTVDLDADTYRFVGTRRRDGAHMYVLEKR